MKEIVVVEGLSSLGTPIRYLFRDVDGKRTGVAQFQSQLSGTWNDSGDHSSCAELLALCVVGCISGELIPALDNIDQLQEEARDRVTSAWRYCSPAESILYVRGHEAGRVRLEVQDEQLPAWVAYNALNEKVKESGNKFVAMTALYHQSVRK